MSNVIKIKALSLLLKIEGIIAPAFQEPPASSNAEIELIWRKKMRLIKSLIRDQKAIEKIIEAVFK